MLSVANTMNKRNIELDKMSAKISDNRPYVGTRNFINTIEIQ